MLDNAKIKGIYTVEKKYELIWLTDARSKSSESLNYFKFAALLTQAFTEKQIKIILDELNCSRKVILDFDKGVAKKIIDKDVNFVEAMKPYFNPSYIQGQLDNPFENTIDLYNSEESEKGGLL